MHGHSSESSPARGVTQGRFSLALPKHLFLELGDLLKLFGPLLYLELNLFGPAALLPRLKFLAQRKGALNFLSRESAVRREEPRDQYNECGTREHDRQPAPFPQFAIELISFQSRVSKHFVGGRRRVRSSRSSLRGDRFEVLLVRGADRRSFRPQA